MPTVIAQKEYKNLLKRQEKVEAELDFLKKMVLTDEEKFIKPSALKKWDRISHDIDSGKGRIFNSITEMKNWQKKFHRA